eukprot:5083895-Amphidinium_carterae.1
MADSLAPKWWHWRLVFHTSGANQRCTCSWNCVSWLPKVAIHHRCGPTEMRTLEEPAPGLPEEE